MRWEEDPPSLRAVPAIAGLTFYLVPLGFGIAAIALGSTTGRVVGVIMVLACLAVAAHVFHSRHRAIS
jgi:hypothetical protein